MRRGLAGDALRERLALICALRAGASARAGHDGRCPSRGSSGCRSWPTTAASASSTTAGSSSSRPTARTFVVTFQVSLLTTAICILLGYPLAYVLSQLPRRAANLCLVAVMLPFWTSLLVRTYAWLVLLQRSGLINTWGIKLGPVDRAASARAQPQRHADRHGPHHAAVPGAAGLGAMRSIDRDYLKAAANLGASPVRAFWTVFFPLSMPGLIAGALIVFILCLGFYVTPAVLGGGKVIMVANRDRQRHRALLQLGRRQRARRRAAGADARLPLRGVARAAPRPAVRRRTRPMSWLDDAASETQITHRGAAVALRARRGSCLRS